MNESTALVPRPGALGLWDRFVGPGMSASENALVLIASFAGASAAAFWVAASGATPLLIILAAVLGLDVVGGAVCNSTDTTKQWYHRPGTGAAHQLAFVLPHLAHVALVAGAFRGSPFDAVYFAVVGGWIIASTLTVIASPDYLKRPVAASLYLIAVALAPYGVGLTPGVEWFIPTLFLKLLVGHLVPERPHPRSS